MGKFKENFKKIFGYGENRKKSRMHNVIGQNKNRGIVKALVNENENLKAKLNFYVNYYFEDKEKWNLTLDLLKKFYNQEKLDDFFSELVKSIAKCTNNEEIHLIIYSNDELNRIFSPNSNSDSGNLLEKYFEEMSYKEIEKKLNADFDSDFELYQIIGREKEYGYLFIKKELPKTLENDFYFIRTLCEYISLALEQYENKLSLKFDNKNKIEFLVNFSHEIKTPLNGIIIYSELLKSTKGKFDKNIEKYIENINISARQLNYLMMDIAESAKTQYSQLKIHREKFLTNVEILNILSVFHSKIIEKKLKIERILTDVEIKSDIAKFNQILYNLISNAIKFGPKGSKITLSSWVENEKFNFEIKDEGCGIDEREKDKIFKFLSQASSDNQKEGSGIGLAISKKIVEIQGGEIGYSSKPGEGTAFWFNLPIDSDL